MSYKQLMKPGGILTAILLGVGLSPTAFGATAAATEVDNTATVDYDVNGTGQTAVLSNTESFFVDVAVDFVVATDDGTTPVSVTLGATAYTSFTLTNNSNSALYFSFAAANRAGTDPAFDGGVTDDGVDMQTPFTIWDDSTGDTAGSFDNNDTDITGSQVQVAAGATRTVLVEADAPTTGTDGDIAVIELTATMVDSDGSAVADDAQANLLNDATFSGIDNSVEIVFVEDVGGQVNGAEDSTAENDGAAADRSAYELQAADIDVAKSSAILNDPLGGADHHVPGSEVEYTVDITNNGAASADAVTIADNFDDTNLTLVTGWTTANSRDLDVTYSNATPDFDCTLDADDGDTDGCGVNSGTGDIEVEVGTIGTGVTATITYRVTIN